MANRIHAKGSFIYEEYIAAIAIKPGMLLSLTSEGKVRPNPSLDGAKGDETIIALESALEGKGVDATYAVGDMVPCMLPSVGTTFRALIETYETIAIGNNLYSHGDGGLYEAGGVVVTAKAVEALAPVATYELLLVRTV
jgi:hypothetical protein